MIVFDGQGDESTGFAGVYPVAGLACLYYHPTEWSLEIVPHCDGKLPADRAVVGESAFFEAT